MSTTNTDTRCIRVRVPDDDYRRLGHRAVDEGRSVGDLVREAVQRFLREGGEEGTREATA